MGSGASPTKLRYAGSSTAPSATAPPNGLGRSSTSSGIPASAHASMQCSIVHTYV